MYSERGLFIDGAWRRMGGAGNSPVLNPATGESLGTTPMAPADDTREAIEAASRTFLGWSVTPAWTHADILHKVADAMLAHTDEAARTMALEAGKPLAQSRREWQLSIDQFRWHAEEARRTYGRIVESRAPSSRTDVTHESVGVVAAFTALELPGGPDCPEGRPGPGSGLHRGGPTVERGAGRRNGDLRLPAGGRRSGSKGGEVATGGSHPVDGKAGFFFQPTVITGLPDDAKALADENFGPIAAITPFENDEEVYGRANDSVYGLSAYAFTRSPAWAREAVARIQWGMVGIDSFALAAAEAPFGGTKYSGTGCEGAADCLDVKLSQVVVR